MAIRVGGLRLFLVVWLIVQYKSSLARKKYGSSFLIVVYVVGRAASEFQLFHLKKLERSEKSQNKMNTFKNGL